MQKFRTFATAMLVATSLAACAPWQAISGPGRSANGNDYGDTTTPANVDVTWSSDEGSTTYVYAPSGCPALMVPATKEAKLTLVTVKGQKYLKYTQLYGEAPMSVISYYEGAHSSTQRSWKPMTDLLPVSGFNGYGDGQIEGVTLKSAEVWTLNKNEPDGACGYAK
jgi:hypothetical protein